MMTASKNLTFTIVASIVLQGCGDECSSYSNYSCKQIEQAEYNVWVYLPSRKDSEKNQFIGTTTGLKSCGAAAYSYASNASSSGNWSYVCCMKTKDSDCAEKHR